MAKKEGESKKGGEKEKSPSALEHWTTEPDAHDYPAAADFLSLILPEASVGELVEALKAAPIQHRKAKDLLRASRLALLPPDNAHVASDLAKVKRGTPLSPVLLVRGDVRLDAALTVADGYHRVCASYWLDENTDIPCHLVDLGPPRQTGTSPAPPPSSGGTTSVQ
ncbi:MAG TPA: hypothetical protein VL961_00760 [Acidimicrobiales bacterium]|nr:hypothetical protein [Acidimicrobiales bacterium]